MNKTLLPQLQTLETSGLVRLLSVQPEFAYAFRHALVHEAVYRTVLKQDRRAIHRAVGETLESGCGGHCDDLAPELGQHFFEAGDAERATRYFVLAAEVAGGRYANLEAVSLYTRAIQAGGAPASAIYRARGLVHEILGNFEQAIDDLAQALSMAQSVHDQRAEWRILLDLALTWSSHDYARTGEYCRRAYELARAIGDPATLAHSLNRLGNWHINVEQPTESRRCHEEALALFQQLGDQHGIAETVDVLGMANFLRGANTQAADLFERAITLHRQQGNQQGLIICLTMQMLTAGVQYNSPPTRPAPIGRRPLEAQGELALELARAIGWKAGEAFVLFITSNYLGPRGNYAGAFAKGNQALALATEIGHKQWMTAACFILGRLHADLLAFGLAVEYFQRGRELAISVGSLLWTRLITSGLALAHVARGELEQAHTALDALGPLNEPALTLAERMAACARAELARAEGHPEQALAVVDELIATLPRESTDEPDVTSTYLSVRRANLLVDLGRCAEAVESVNAGLATAEAFGERAPVWRLRQTLARAYQAQGRSADAESELSLAQQLILELAAAVPDPELRQQFVDNARAGAFN